MLTSNLCVQYKTQKILNLTSLTEKCLSVSYISHGGVGVVKVWVVVSVVVVVEQPQHAGVGGGEGGASC